MTWLLLSVVMVLIIYPSSQKMLDNAIREHLRAHLLLTLDESQFGNASSRENDQKALQRIGGAINAALQNLVVTHWFAAQKECAVRLLRIDDVAIDNGPFGHTVSLKLPRNQMQREIVVGVSCAPGWWLALGSACLLGLLFLAINFYLPSPLSRAQRHWFNYLLECGYSESEASSAVSGSGASGRDLLPIQTDCLERLHDTQLRNFSWALKVASDARVAALDENALDWFLLGLGADAASMSSALELAASEDLVVIDLKAMKLHIHGLRVPMSRTPLFYYAWYAMRRVDGDGWITNPASNRPDAVLGQQLVQLMSRFEGHAKAINDLQRAGLKARTLDQNRSKIKDDIVAALGESLAQAYLFEASKHPDGLHMRYRLQVESSRIRIVS
ncbi:MAG: hypothetical protein R3E50_16315 [Halioglobus sp.]